MTEEGFADTTGATNPEARNWAMFVHLAALAGFIVPFGNLLGPLIIWLVQRDRWPFVREHGREAVNFQLTVLAIQIVLALAALASMVGSIFVFSAAAGSNSDETAAFAVFGVFGFYGLLGLSFLIGVASWILAIVGGVKASGGQDFRYPIAFRLL